MGAAKPVWFAVAVTVALAAFGSVPPAIATSPAGLPAAAPSKSPTPKTTRKPTPKPKPKPKPKPTPKPSPSPQRCELPKGLPASDMTSEPWAQQKLNFTEVWPLTQGEGIKVAVVDSGVDASHAQLPSVEAYDDTHTSARDCVGHGTEIAGIIAAKDLRKQRVPFLGVAPMVHLMSFKMAITDSDNDPHFLAQAIRDAADRGARIMNISSQTPNYDYLKSAVEYAQRKGTLIVAAAGNTAPEKKDSEQALYPASYPGVISVGAIDSQGKVTNYSDSKSNVSVVAPGKGIVATWPGGDYRSADGTSFSTPYVAGTAALVWSYHPHLTSAQVKYRIEVTADGATAAGTGHGTINPLRAVTAVLPEENGQAPAPAKAGPVAIAAPRKVDHFTRTLALSFVVGALGIAAAIGAGGLIVPAGRRRGWRPGRRTPPPDPTGPDST
ncbi:MAG: peptidase and in kexin sedolisin [Actinomycetia bacterium]|nr:peptidase and in kexin sedolisin [Actinomycetes bacterium]